MGIDFSKFSQEIQAKIKAALSDNKIDAAEFRAMKLEKDVANKLMQELAGNQEFLGDGYITMQNKNKTLILLDKPVDNSFVPLTKDSLEYYHQYNKDVAQGIYKDGMLYMADSKGRLLKDRFNNYICEKVLVQEQTGETQDISGNFEIIENEPTERTNRRFAVALIRSMYADVIGELQTIISQMGVMDAGFWREALGMGVQALADLKENQDMITATTMKKIERIEAERDNICNSLNDLIDSPAEFERKFYQLVGKDYSDNAFNELRDIQHNQNDKASKTKFKECTAKFKELYPENNISQNIENWEDSVEYQKTADEIANIVVMLYMTGGIGKVFQGSVQTMARNILLAAAKGDKKAVMANFAKLAPEVQTIWKSLAKKEFEVALTQTVTPMAQSAATMSTWEGVKAFLNNLTNAEDMSPEELLLRTLEGIKGGAEMGVIMGGLEVTAIAPIMTKLAPVLNKLSGASAEISGLIEKGNGVVSMEKVMETYTKASETFRGKIVKEGAHTLVALPVLTTGFTATDTSFHFDEAEFRKQLLDEAATDEEREAIRKMNSFDLRLEFAKTDFIGQVKGMATIEGVGIMFRRLQAGRLAAQSLNQHHKDILGANLRPVKENGKTVYEICSPEGEVLPVKDGNKTLTRFSSIEEATAAYSALCMSVYSEINAQINEAGTREAGSKEVEAETKPNQETPQPETYQEITYETKNKPRVENSPVQISQSENISYEEVIEKARNLRYPGGEPVFSEFHMEYVEELAKSNPALLNSLLSVKDTEGLPLFGPEEYYDIYFAYKSNPDATKELLSGERKIPYYMIRVFASALDENPSLVKEWVYAKNQNGSFKYPLEMLNEMTYNGLHLPEIPKKDFDRIMLCFDKITKFLEENNIDSQDVYNFMITEDGVFKFEVINDSYKYELNKEGKLLRKVIEKKEVQEIDETSESGRTRYTGTFEGGWGLHTDLINAEREIKDDNGNVLYKEIYKQSSIEGKYDIIRIEPDGKEWKIGFAEKTPAGEIVEERNFCIDENTPTQVIYISNSNGNRYTKTKVLDTKTNEILFENTQKFKVINENHFESEENGVKYDIRYSKDKVEVTTDKGETFELSIGENGVLDENMLPLLKQLPGSMLEAISKFGLGRLRISYNLDANGEYKPYQNLMMIRADIVKNGDINTLLHELGHYIDIATEIHDNTDVRTAFAKELEEFKKNASFREKQIMSNFIKDSYTTDSALLETIAEINAMVHGNITSRGYELAEIYLHKYFPKTFAKVAKALRGEEAEGVKLEGVDIREVGANVKLNQKARQSETLNDGKYSRPLTEYDKIGNKIFELKQKDVAENPEKIAELKAEIEVLRKTEPQKAEELQVILEMFTNPTKAKDVTDTQVDAVVNYLNSHYDNVKTYLTIQAGQIGISDKNIGDFGHRIKGEWSTRDKITNYINDAIKKGKDKTLLDAYNDVRDKYACRTVFDKGDYTNHPEIVKILEEGNYSDAAYRKAQLRAAEIQSQPAVDMLKEAMRKAVKEGKDLSIMRISNYTSEGGIPIFSEAQLAELKDCGIELGIDVSFIKLASEADPNTNRMIVDGATTKAQPSGYTALQINFVTKSGEIIEWQYRGELVNKFAEAEHLPYDIRTGKHPWRQYPELETLYKPVADLLNEKNMPEYAYNQLNRYFTDYYNHLRKLELGFESKEPRLEDYEKWKAKDKDGVEREYTFKFDKRLSGQNLMKLHDYGEGIKDGVIMPERALEEYNTEVGHIEVKQDINNPIQAAKPLSRDEMVKDLKELGLSESDIAHINTEHSMLSSAIELIKTMKEYNPEKFGNFSSGLLVNLFNHPENVFNNEDSPFLHYATRDNLKALLEVAKFEGSPLEDINFWQDTDVSQLYRMAKHYFDVTGEKFPIENMTRSNKEFRTDFPTNEQVDVALRMKKAGLWSEYAMFSHSMEVESPQKVNDQFVAEIKELKAQAKAQGVNLSIEYGLNDEGIELVNRLKEYNDKSPIDFQTISKLINNTYLHPKTVIFYLELQEKGINVSPKMLGNLLREIDSAFSSSADADSRKDMAMFFIEHQDIYNTAPESCNYAVRFADKNNIELTKTLLLDKEFPNNFAYRIQQSVSLRGNLPNYKATDEEAVLFIQNKAKFAQKLCLDKTLNCPKEFAVKLIENYYDGCEETVINGIKTGLLDRHPRLINYPADCWKNILKRNLTGREADQVAINLGYSPVLNYARAKDDNIVEKHTRLRQDALDNKDLLKSGMEDISDIEVRNVTGRSEAIRTLDLIGLSNTEAAFPLMLEEFGEFLRETSELSETKLSDANKELLMERVNPANTQKAKSLQKEITKLKKQINKAVGEENLSKIQDIQAQKSEVDASISDLKTQLDNARTAIPEYKAIADKMVNLNQKSKEYKEYEKQLAEIENQRPEIVSLKNSIKEQQKQSKALNGQAQSVYYNCENAAEVKELMKQLSPKQKELKEYLAQYSGIEPQEVVTKVRVLYALSEISTEEEMANFIKMIKPSSSENNAAWNEAVNKKIFQKLGVEYDETLSQKLDLINCKYISKMFISNEEFFENMRILVDVIKSNPELSVVEAIDRMPQNIETKRIFEELGFDYEKFTKTDKNSFTSVKVKLSAEEAKQASIHNLEEDLNDALFKLLPQKVTEPIFKQLKDELGVEFIKSQKDNWEGDGFNAGTTEYYRLYKNGKPISFEDMDKIITLIKREINKNDFWTRTQGDEELDNARKTMYTHLIKMRTQEVDNALNIKDGEVAEIEVRKTDMYDIKKALGLGNDAQCCTALGRNMNEWSAPTYIMNKCIGAIELSDKGSFVGNTMIYLAYVDGKPALVLDNIELKTKYQNNDKIRDTFIEYAKKLCAEIGQPDLPIYAGPNRHKLNMDIYPKEKHTMEIIGNSGDQEVYADYDASPHFVGQGEKAEIDMYRIR